MGSPTPLHILLALLIILPLFYLAGPFSASSPPPGYHSATADARLARFLDAVTPKQGQVYSGHTSVGGGNGGIGSGSIGGGSGSGRGGKKIVLWPLGEESKVMGRPGVRGGSWRSPVGMGSEDEDVTKVEMEAGMMGTEVEVQDEAPDEEDMSQLSAVTGKDEVTGHT